MNLEVEKCCILKYREGRPNHYLKIGPDIGTFGDLSPSNVQMLGTFPPLDFFSDFYLRSSLERERTRKQGDGPRERERES